jgi:hypothetical protein
MVTTLTPAPSFDVYYGLTQPTGAGSSNKAMTIILIATLIISAGITFYVVSQNIKLKRIIGDMTPKEPGKN